MQSLDQALMLVSELFAAESSAKRMRSIMEEPVARGSEKFELNDGAFDHVAFWRHGAGETGCAEARRSLPMYFTAREGGYGTRWSFRAPVSLR